MRMRRSRASILRSLPASPSSSRWITRPVPGSRTHWVLVYDRQGDDYLIQDPWPCPPERGPVTLLPRFGHGKPLHRAIRAIAWYECSLGAPLPSPSTPLPVPVDTDLVIEPLPSVTAGLKLHVAASINSVANYAEMPNMRLNVIEEKEGALAKLAKADQWIFVHDRNGHQGFVAAWYVRIAQSPVPSTPPPTPPTPSTPLPPGTPPPASEPKRFQVVVSRNVGTLGLSVRVEPSLGAEKVNIEKAGSTPYGRRTRGYGSSEDRQTGPVAGHQSDQ